VIWHFLVVQMPHARDKRMVTLLLRPRDRVSLQAKGPEDVIGMILDHIFRNISTLFPALWARFDVNVRHQILPGFQISEHVIGGLRPPRRQDQGEQKTPTV
jgi:hypothetical protein